VVVLPPILNGVFVGSARNASPLSGVPSAHRQEFEGQIKDGKEQINQVLVPVVCPERDFCCRLRYYSFFAPEAL
jgi:hypothetical protein